MQRQGLTIPLLIGGATTSRAHTAVKVDPQYDGPVVWVKDASRSVPVAAALLSDAQRPEPAGRRQADYDALRGHGTPTAHDRPMLVRHRRRPAPTGPPIDWTAAGRPATGARPGVHVLRRLRPRRAARLHRLAAVLQRLGDEGAFPDILNNPASGEAARKLYDDAQEMLDRHGRREAGSGPAAWSGFFPANTVGDDIERLPRRVAHRGAGHAPPACASRASTATACPTGRWPTSSRRARPGCRDHVGAFAVTAGLGMRERVAAFKEALDDYSAILLEALADRLAEAFAERLHERVRTELWGYAPDEQPRPART